MKVLIDDKIPYIKGIIEQLPYPEPILVKYLPGRHITRKEAADADALIIRTRTRCDSSLLENSPIQFIATATIGFDHIDTRYCEENGIYWTNAPGCNAESVAQYLESIFYLLSAHRKLIFSETTLGIIGVGHVGRQVEQVATALGMKTMRCDPPRADKEGPSDFCTLDELAEECTLLTFHTPLVTDGLYPTFHLVDSALLSRMRKGSYLINTSRGEIVDNEALLHALDEGHLAEVILDVWENEPHPLPELLKKAFIGTPHIAGYSADGKANATRMSLESFCRFFDIPANFHIEPPAPLHPVIHAESLSEAILSVYDPRRDSEALKTNPDQFEQLRENYPLRREKQAYTWVLHPQNN